MSAKVYKILLFLKRSPGITTEEFRDYYENHHVPLCLNYAKGITHYVRRYLEPKPRVETGDGKDIGYDVITELWFDNETVYQGTVAHLATSLMPQDVIDDEDVLFDRQATRLATTVECVTELA